MPANITNLPHPSHHPTPIDGDHLTVTGQKTGTHGSLWQRIADTRKAPTP